MKKPAARDFEDLLQVSYIIIKFNQQLLMFLKCIIPVIEGLFEPPHNTIVHDLLFTMASWHALAKLRMHTESTLSKLDNLTTQLGAHIRRFANVTCQKYVTYELEREKGARQRRQAKKTSKKGPPIEVKKRKEFNLSTPKLHLLGHYVPVIRLFGSTTGYSTQRV